MHDDDYDVLASIFEDDDPIEPSDEMKALYEQARNLAYLALLDDEDMATDVRQ